MRAGQDTARAQTAPGHEPAFRTIVRLVIAGIRRHIENGRARRELSALDERMLKDIGLMRDDDGRWLIDRTATEPLQRYRTPKR